MNRNSLKLSENDEFNLNLLNIQQAATQLAIYSDLLSYKAVLEGKELIFEKYIDMERKLDGVTPDVTSLQSLYIYAIAKVMFSFVGVSRYNELYNKSLKGEWEYSLIPNIYINIYNSLGLTGLVLAINAANEFYSRDVTTPIFGIR